MGMLHDIFVIRALLRVLCVCSTYCRFFSLGFFERFPYVLRISSAHFLVGSGSVHG